uniref:Sterol-4-alpha-carboxylate 3-dehydrogenase, decarboxylating isoform X1 n=1 Tax=Petromyzon marinus TaxID=7757 RepID=A0AAJ7T7G3_PETMA|nr:sterol-4-alpha-carboxylate 3-dehydrogenase, decarboxylating isoform X1 [Petromyzon marinus]XP_032811548.1 sterol-4-alpha-carboxylate 3-dehydrogenase, decarboxylating isoform X1 [Petromyzon marinus]XP_032811549.1 sterol-4-alpha-carboxylate 3-dehydrogenase, decarboxylating isoform X1 [Petromyzon marinus]
MATRNRAGPPPASERLPDLRSPPVGGALRELLAVTSHFHSLLGPVKALKFVREGHGPECALVGSGFELLRTLGPARSPAGQLLEGAVRGQQVGHGCGGTSVAVLAGEWGRALARCVKESAVPLPEVTRTAVEAIDECARAVMMLTFPIAPPRFIDSDDDDDDNDDNDDEEAGSSLATEDLWRLSCDGSTAAPNPGSSARWDQAALCVSNSRVAAQPRRLLSRHFHSTSAKPRGAYGSIRSSCGEDHGRCPNAGESVPSEDVTKTHVLPRRPSTRSSKDSTRSEVPITVCGVGRLAWGLSHGQEREMGLAWDTYLVQIRARHGLALRLEFDLRCIVTVLTPGWSEDASRVVDGYLTSVPATDAAVARSLSGRPLGALLFGGDLTAGHRHPGFQGLERGQVVFWCGMDREQSGFSTPGSHPGASKPYEPRQPGSTNYGSQPAPDATSPWQAEEQDAWLEETALALSGTRARLVLARGEICPQLAERGTNLGIIFLPRVPAAVLRAVSQASSAKILTYPCQAGASHAATLSLELIDEELEAAVPTARRAGASRSSDGGTRVIVKTAAVQSVVLCGRVPCRLPVMESRFWACARRLSGAINDGQVLPGAGVSELHCVRLLQDMASRAQSSALGSGADAAASQVHRLNSRPEGDAQPECGGGGGAWWCGESHRHHPAVLQALADGWRRYLVIAMYNTGCYRSQWEAAAVVSTVEARGEVGPVIPGVGGPKEVEGGGGEGVTGPVYDGAAAKVGTWQAALDVVLLVLQADAEVVSGVGHSRWGHSDDDNDCEISTKEVMTPQLRR